MRFMSALTFVLAIGLVQAHGQAPKNSGDLQSRYVSACLHAGDTEAYCRCEFNIVKDNQSAMALIEVLIRVNEMPDDEVRKIYFQKLPAGDAQRILQVAQEINTAAQKCPDVRHP